MKIARLGTLFFSERACIPKWIFWSWNAVFLSVALFGILPGIVPGLIRGVLEEQIPFDLLVSVALLIVVPLAAIVSGACFFRRSSLRLLRLFYGVEAPLFLFCLVRLFLVRELTTATWLVVGLLIATILAQVLLLCGRPPARGFRGLAEALLLSLGLLGALFLALLLSFYAVPVLAELLVGFLRFSWVAELGELFWEALSRGAWFVLPTLLLALYSATLFGLMPLLLIGLTANGFWGYHRAWRGRVGALRASLPLVAAVCLILPLWALVNEQPQAEAFRLLEQEPESDAERFLILEESERIRRGLLNAYLAPYRYLATVERAGHVSSLYEDSLRLPSAWAEQVQAAYNVVAAPFLYDGTSWPADRDRAAELYAAVFDRPIQKGERAAIRRAMAATYDQDDREAGLLNVDEQRVLLTKQEISIAEEEGWATIEVHEAYENQTAREEEILYYFSLPTSAVVTGLWLGESEDRAASERFVVAPRGAAQAVYRQEVRRRVDPALLEQIGPRQYRLRVFPIPSHGRMHVWFRYVALPEGDVWPMASLIERRNVFWDCSTRRSVNGLPVRSAERASWMPGPVPRLKLRPARPYRVCLEPGLSILARPVAPIDPAELNQLEGRRYAVVLDRSQSMERHRDDVERELSWLNEVVGRTNRVELYLASSPFRNEPSIRIDDMGAFDPGRVLYFGSQNPGELLRQFAHLQLGTAYDAIFVLTDEQSMDLADDRRPVRDFGAPVWMVHLGERLPPGYDDATLETIQRRGGGTVSSFREAFSHLLLADRHGPSFLGVAGGYAFRLEGGGTEETPSRALGQLALGRFVSAAIQVADLDSLGELDRIHALARRYEIVTPYSSMLVLVNQRQRDALRQLENQEDRFQREVENGEEALAHPSMISGTPEPEEWLLILLVMFGLSALLTNKRGRSASPKSQIIV